MRRFIINSPISSSSETKKRQIGEMVNVETNLVIFVLVLRDGNFNNIIKVPISGGGAHMVGSEV